MVSVSVSVSERESIGRLPSPTTTHHSPPLSSPISSRQRVGLLMVVGERGENAINQSRWIRSVCLSVLSLTAHKPPLFEW